MEPSLTEQAQRQFPCRKCGAKLVFAPGTTALACPYCGQHNAIEQDPRGVDEMDFLAYLQAASREQAVVETLTVRCDACGAELSLAPNTTADRCTFCGTGIVATAASARLIKPHCVLPFHVTHDQSRQLFGRWLASLWFAPNDLVRSAQGSGIKGVYLPCWTYDSDTDTHYTGERGDDYWTTETYTTIENGRTVTRTRQVKRTRWTSVSGRVFESFDDVLVLASESLPRKYVERLEPWDLKNFVPYADEYLAGFSAQSYQVDLAEGFVRAQAIMAEPIRQSICRDIGGDHQRIHDANTRYSNITFKHGLLPVWISAYRYADRAFRFLVNARTGEVQGERPWSVWKIVLAALLGIAVALVIVLLVGRR
jgi:DNA-directed RNA polymerase subunit RPC12/RpoP